jgi:aminoglycoside phosphotransferase (APT) family kinase protein
VNLTGPNSVRPSDTSTHSTRQRSRRCHRSPTRSPGGGRIERYAPEVPGLLQRWDEATVALGANDGGVLIHGDLNVGNVLWGNPVLLCDLEALCTGPAEWDLAKLYNSAAVLHGDGAARLLRAGYVGPVRAGVLDACLVVDHIKSTTWQLSEIDAGINLGVERGALLAALADGQVVEQSRADGA